MEQELDRVVQAIAVASNPTPAQTSLQPDALAYLQTIEQNAAETWRIAFPLFLDTAADGSRKYPAEVRFFALRVLDNFFDSRFEPFDAETFQTIQRHLVGYLQAEYVYGGADSQSSYMRNKFTHTLSLFFLCTYTNQWPTFFVDLFSLIRSSSDDALFNRHIALLFFHLVLEISGEVADQMIKAARQYTQLRVERDGRVRDALRERDATRINEAVLTIVADAAERMANLQKSPDNAKQITDAVEVVDWGVRTFSSYVSWIDINLTVTSTTVPLLFTLLNDQSLPIRLATSSALTRIVSKGLKEPRDKLQLLKVLSLGQVLDALEQKTHQQQIERGSETDEGEESFREALGKMFNIFGLELTKLDDSPDEQVRAEATQYLTQSLPVLVRFMADEYDDTCSTVFPLLQVILTTYKRQRKVSTESIEPEKRTFLASLLEVILAKMKWDPDTDYDDLDEEDAAEFEKLRKELRTFADSITSIDQELVTSAVRNLAFSTLNAHQSGVNVKWYDAELGVYMVYIFGEINKSGAKGRAAFCNTPVNIEKESRKGTDYSEYALTTLGELLFALTQSNLSSHPHRAVTLQFFETVSRYTDFFKVRKVCIVPTLEAFVDTRGLHHPDASFRSRLSFLFSRFIREIRNDIPGDICPNIAQTLRDLLELQVELPDPEEVETDILTEAARSSQFEDQLFLYETVGILCAITAKSGVQDPTAALLSFVKPLMDKLSESLQAYRTNPQDIVPLVMTHHVIFALGTIAKGYPDYPSPTPEGFVSLSLDVFAQVAQAILVCLENMNIIKIVREATRFAFARILATAGPNVTSYIPALMSNLLVHFEPTELVEFINFIVLLIYKLQDEMFAVLDELVGPLSNHIIGILSQPVTDSEVQKEHLETKKAYLGLLNSIISSKASGVLISERNKASFEPLMQNMAGIAEDVSDPGSEKLAFIFLNRCVTAWMSAESDSSKPLPGFEQFIYERIVPAAFRVPAAPGLNVKDGQVTVVLHELANFLHNLGRTRGAEAYEYFLNVFLPAQNWPPEMATDFTSKLRELDAKGFRKYFTDFVRSTRAT
ncbi:ARM repeat-containing protein [Cylindrobasidium torrendii FP15055 ss-10]|uniref:Exportin-T n=1 Tax=Cylindrobasidium torrendii FP15055 ss-10 TaxID=1314674 RepID=A0A0D7BQ86_9AGAR|nr:ARM repeat-containing protein [Cylindrobasidium torrendii FP15055 ss-10]